jgi:hypothetical protein
MKKLPEGDLWNLIGPGLNQSEPKISGSTSSGRHFKRHN